MSPPATSLHKPCRVPVPELPREPRCQLGFGICTEVALGKGSPGLSRCSASFSPCSGGRWGWTEDTLASCHPWARSRCSVGPVLCDRGAWGQVEMGVRFVGVRNHPWVLRWSQPGHNRVRCRTWVYLCSCGTRPRDGSRRRRWTLLDRRTGRSGIGRADGPCGDLFVPITLPATPCLPAGPSPASLGPPARLEDVLAHPCRRLGADSGSVGTELDACVRSGADIGTDRANFCILV